MELPEYVQNQNNLKKDLQLLNSSHANLSNLPAELIIKILLNCPPISILRMQAVSTYFKYIAMDNSVWSTKCKRHFVYQYNYLMLIMTNKERIEAAWKNIFKNYYLNYINHVCSSKIKHLISAIRENDIDAIRIQRFDSADFMISFDVNLYSKLLLGASQKILDYVYYVIKRQLPVGIKDQSGWTRTHWAAYCNQLEECKTLTDNFNQDLANTVICGCCPPATILIAAEYGHLELLKYLISKKISSDFTNRLDTPLCLAVKNGFKEAAIFLLEQGANVNHTGSQNETPLIKAIKYHHLQLIEVLIARGAKINQFNCFGTALIYAVKMRCLPSIELLLKLGADPNLAGNDHLQTPLCMAVEYNDIEIIQLLLRFGVNVNLASPFQNIYPLHIAAQNGSLAAVKKLLCNGADINNVDQDGRTAFWIAAGHGNCEMMHLLLQNKAAIDLANNRGETPVWRAVYKDRQKAVELLILYQANIHLADNNGHTPIAIALKCNYQEIINLFKMAELINKCLYGQLTEQTDFNCLTSLTPELACHWFVSLSYHISCEDVERVRSFILGIHDVLCTPLSQFKLNDSIDFDDSNKSLHLLNLCFAALLKSTCFDKDEKLKKLRVQSFELFKTSLIALPAEKKLEKLRDARTQSIFCQHRARFFKPANTNTVMQIDRMIEYETRNVFKF